MVSRNGYSMVIKEVLLNFKEERFYVKKVTQEKILCRVRGEILVSDT